MHSFSRRSLAVRVRTRRALAAIATASAGPMPGVSVVGSLPDQPQRAGNAAQPPSRADRRRGHGRTTEQQAAVLNLIAANLVDAERAAQDCIEKEKADWEAKLEKLAAEGLAEPRPYSYLDLDKARDELDDRTAERRVARRRDRTRPRKRSTRATEEQNRHRARCCAAPRTSWNTTTTPRAVAALTQAVADAEHELTAAEQMLGLAPGRAGQFAARPAGAIAAASTMPSSWSTLYEQDAVFTPAMRDEVLADLDARGKAAAGRAKQLTDDLNKFLQPQWYQARERLDEARAAPINRSWRRWRPRCRPRTSPSNWPTTRSASTSPRSDRISDLRTAWQRRFEHGQFAGADRSTRRNWVDETKAARERLRSDAATLHAKSRERPEATQHDRKEAAGRRQGRRDAPLLARQDERVARSSSAASARRRLAELEPARRVFDKLIEDLTGGTISVGRDALARRGPRGRRACLGLRGRQHPGPLDHGRPDRQGPVHVFPRHLRLARCSAGRSGGGCCRGWA